MKKQRMFFSKVKLLSNITLTILKEPHEFREVMLIKTSRLGGIVLGLLTASFPTNYTMH